MKVLCPYAGPFSQPTLRDNQPTSAVSALIFPSTGTDRPMQIVLTQIRCQRMQHLVRTVTISIWQSSTGLYGSSEMRTDAGFRQVFGVVGKGGH